MFSSRPARRDLTTIFSRALQKIIPAMTKEYLAQYTWSPPPSLSTFLQSIVLFRAILGMGSRLTLLSADCYSRPHIAVENKALSVFFRQGRVEHSGLVMRAGLRNFFFKRGQFWAREALCLFSFNAHTHVTHLARIAPHKWYTAHICRQGWIAKRPNAHAEVLSPSSAKCCSK